MTKETKTRSKSTAQKVSDLPSRRKTRGKFIRRKVVFTAKAPAESQVYLAGSFNDWNPQAKLLRFDAKTDTHTAFIYLKPGTYEYKFVVDGVWMLDAGNPLHVSNGLNSMNNVIVVE
ncbi:MAG: glycogen-binding domain-containing protein [Victivallales bacterium]|nr:glycogen-binding domain-containing protein [Victivallales bacterium]